MRIVRNLSLVLAAVLAGTLGASGVTYALWSSQATASSSVTAGTVGVTLSGSGGLATAYASTALTKTATLTVVNSGTVASNYSTAVALAAGSSSELASAVVVTAWLAAGSCGSPSSTATSGTWSSLPTISGTLAAAASAQWCVQTSITSSQANSLAGRSVTPTLTTTATVGSWTAPGADVAFLQSVSAVAAAPPAPPVNPAAWNLLKTTLSPQLCLSPRWGNGDPGQLLAQEICASSNPQSAAQYWRVVDERLVSSKGAYWATSSASAGAALSVTYTSSASALWSVLSNANGTVSFALKAFPTLCASITGAATSVNATLSLATCAAGIAAQEFQVQVYAVPSPPPVNLTPGGNEYSRTFSWPGLTGYENYVQYRVLLDGSELPTSQYNPANGHHTTVQFQHTNAALMAHGVGSHAITVQQSVNGSAWTVTGTATLIMTADGKLNAG